MADELAALRRSVESFPAAVLARLRAVALKKGHEAAGIAARLAPRNDAGPRGRLNEGEKHLNESIVVVEQPAQQTVLVRTETPWNPNLGYWIEYGTVKMPARPYMRPAADRIEKSLQSEMVAAATGVADEAFR